MNVLMVSRHHRIWPPVIGYKLKNGLRLKKILFKTMRKEYGYVDGKFQSWKEVEGVFE